MLRVEQAADRAEIARLREIVEAKPDSRVRDRRRRVADLGERLAWLNPGREHGGDGKIVHLISDLIAAETGRCVSLETIRTDLICALGQPRSGPSQDNTNTAPRFRTLSAKAAS